MPIFEYECTECGKRTEHLQLSSAVPLTACPECNGKVRKLMSAPAFQFKGSGWYVTDYSRKGKAAETSDGNGAKEISTASSDATDSKKSGGSEKSSAAETSPAKSSSAKSTSPSE